MGIFGRGGEEEKKTEEVSGENKGSIVSSSKELLVREASEKGQQRSERDFSGAWRAS